MRKIGTENTDARTESGDSKGPASPSVIKKNWRPILIVGVLMFLAAFVRVFFAYGISAESGFALSGGTTASNNLMALDNLLSNGIVTFFNESLYYPYGSTGVAPMVLVFIMYPFALVANVFLHDTTTAASFALALSGPLFGVLSVIPMYLVGREITGKRLGGILAALFLALCPIAVQETVFSNGTGISLVLFFSIFAVYFLIKAIKAGGLTDGARDSADRNKVLKYAAVSGILLAVAGLCWTGYRALVLPIVAIMVVQTLIDRFRGRDPMPAAFMYSVVVLLGALIPGIYFAAAGLWDDVASGITVLALLSSAMCVAYSALAKKPWTLVLPVFVIVIAAIFAVMWFAVPDLFSAVVGGNSMMNPDYQGILAANKLSLSKLASYFGWMTFWFIPLIVAYRLYRIKQNVVSPLYLFVLVWLLAVPVFSCSTNAQACVATTAFALAFALMIIWVLDHVDFKAYFSGIKTAEGKYKIKRLFRPAPFIAIIMALFLVAGPNMFYVIDAGMSSNQSQDINEDLGTDRFGGIGYYVPTDDTWQVPGALEQLKKENPLMDGSMAGWMDYSNDIPMYGGFDSFTDTQGNGLLEFSQIMLANGVDGSSTVAMLIAMMKYAESKGIDVDSALTDAGMTAEDLKVVKGVMDSADYKPTGKDTVRKMVTLDTETYGHMSPDISDANIKAMYLEHFLTEKYHTYQISDMYENVSVACGKTINHFMVTGDMLPLFYSNAFTQMALMAGFTIDPNTNGISGMMDVDWLQYYMYQKVVFTYTERMYDSLLYRMYIGMTPSEAGYKSLSDYIGALQSADASVKFAPGYGLSNFNISYWHVMYNPAEGADPADKAGWEDMKASEAIDLQKTNGGTINYLSGKPIVFSYAYNGVGAEPVEGAVTDAGEGVKGIRVSAIDSNGVLRATTYTDAQGKFKLNVPAYDAASGEYATLVYYAASNGTSGGSLLNTVKVTDTASYDIEIDSESSVDVTLRYYTDSSVEVSNEELYEVTFTGKNTGEVYTDTLDNFPIDMKLDSYTVSVKCEGTEVYKGTFNVIDQPMHNAVFEIGTVKYTLNLKGQDGACPEGIAKVKISGIYELESDVVDGTAVFNAPKGDYEVSFIGEVSTDLFMTTVGTLHISSDSSKDVPVISAAEIKVSGVDNVPVTVSNSSYSAVFIPEAGANSIMVPVSDIGTTTYYVTALKGGSIAYKTVELDNTSTSEDISMVLSSDVTKVTGKVTDSSGKETAATVKFKVDDCVLTYASGSDGKYTAYIPRNVDQTVYADNNLDAVLKSLPAEDVETKELDIQLKTAYKVDSEVKWGDYYFPHTDVVVKFSGYDGEAVPVEWVFTTEQYSKSSVQSSLNEFKFFLPKEAAADVTHTLAFNIDFLWYEGATPSEHSNSKVQTVNADTHRVDRFELSTYSKVKVTMDADVETMLDGLKLKVGNGSPQTIGTDTLEYSVSSKYSSLSVVLGTWESEDHTDFYCKNDFKIDPADYVGEVPEIDINDLLGIEEEDPALYESALYNAIAYKSLYIKLAEGASFTLTDADRLEKVKTIKEEGNKLDGYTWYQVKCQYDEDGSSVPVTMKASLDSKIWMNANVELVPAAAGEDRSVMMIGAEGVSIGTQSGPAADPVYADPEPLLDEYTVKGFVGVVGNGDMTVTSDSLKLDFDVKIRDGTYTVKLLKADDWKFAFKVTAGDIEYANYDLDDPDGPKKVEERPVTGDCRINMVCDGNTNAIPAENVVLETDNGIMYGVSFDIPAGSIENNSDKGSIFKIEPAAGWSQISFSYNGEDVSEIYVPANDDNDYPIEVIGWYNSTQYGVGSDLLVNVNGSTKYSVLFEDTAVAEPSATENLVYVNKVTDNIGDFQYSYNLTVNNLSGKTNLMTFDALSAEGWYLSVTSKNGTITIVQDVTPTPVGTAHVTVPLMTGVNTVAITFTPVADASASGIPALKVTDLKVGDLKLNTSDSEKVVISEDGKSASIDAEHRETTVESQDMTANGGGVYNEKGDMPVIVWVLVALIILGTILTIWMASKRGVFARRK